MDFFLPYLLSILINSNAIELMPPGTMDDSWLRNQYTYVSETSCMPPDCRLIEETLVD